MAKRRNQSLIDSDSSESESETNIESELLSLAKKRQRTDENGEHAKPEGTSDSSSGSESQSGTDSDSNSESDWDADERKAQQSNIMKVNEEIKDEHNAVKQTSPYQEKLADKPVSDQEEGEVSDSNNEEEEAESKVIPKAAGSSGSDSDYSDSSSESEFDDGYDENLMGDDDDRKRLNNLSEKERETEIFKRIEQRDFMRTRWEIERKLKLARRGEKAHKSRRGHKSNKRSNKQYTVETKQDASSIAASALAKLDALTAAQKAESKVESNTDMPLSTTVETETHDDDDEEKGEFDDITGKELSVLDHKERSKERKKNVEMNRTDDKRSSAMALLKAKREGKAKREEEEAKRQAERERDEDKELETVAGGKSNVKLKASEIYSDDSGSSDWDDDPKPTEQGSRSSSRSRSSDSESGDEKAPRSRGSPVYITTREELNKIRLSRFKMERFINLPIFERTVMNCFVRISIGNNGQKPVYRVAEIVGAVETAKIYNLGKIRTNRGLRLRHGTQERVFRLEFISNQEFSETEFNKWREVCADQNVLMPTLETVERKQKDVQFAMNYEYKEEDVDKLIEEKNRLRNRPTNYAMRKSCLMKERDAAMIRGEYEEARKLGEEIEELESRASELDKKRSSSLSLISYINDRNRKRNVADAEKAIMEEARANRGQRISDPFTRRITQPRMGFNKQDKNESGEETFKRPISALPPKPIESLKPEDVLDAPIDNGNTLTTKQPPPLDKEGQAAYSLYSLHDFDIDLDVVMPANSANVLPQPIAKGQQVVQRRSLNLEDYKKKRGLI